MPSVLFVCLGNICRSPTAEAVLKKKAKLCGVDLCVESAGTSAVHQGEPPDMRSIKAGERRGYDFTGQKSRQVTPGDFCIFDYVLAMDENNLTDLKRLKPLQDSTHLQLFLNFALNSTHINVPDPYYGGPTGFDTVLDLIEAASEGLISHICDVSAAT